VFRPGKNLDPRISPIWPLADRAAHVVDHVMPDVPVRQWVLTSIGLKG